MTATDRPNNVRPLRPVKTTFPATTADDAWSTENGSYDPTRFYTGSSDGKGNHNTVQVAVPPALAVEIDRLVQSGAISEYQTRQDFFRDAIIHRAHWIAELLGSAAFKKRVSMAQKVALLAQQERDKADMDRLLDDLERIIKGDVATQDFTHLAEIYETWEQEVDAMPPSQKAKGKRILDVHRHLIDQGDRE